MTNSEREAIVRAAICDERLQKGPVLLLRAIAEMLDSGLNRVTQQEIADALGRSIPWVHATAEHLSRCGYLRMDRRVWNREARYSVKLPTPSELAFRGRSVWCMQS